MKIDALAISHTRQRCLVTMAMLQELRGVAPTYGELGRVLGVTRQSVRDIMTYFERTGVARRLPGTPSRFLRLTPRGRAIYRQIMPHHARLVETIRSAHEQG